MKELIEQAEPNILAKFCQKHDHKYKRTYLAKRLKVSAANLSWWLKQDREKFTIGFIERIEALDKEL